MFPVVIHDGKSELPNHDIMYIVAKEGIFLKKKLGLIESITPVKNISILESIIPTAKMNIPKIPGHIAAKAKAFFKEVYNVYHSEAIVVLYLNEKTNKYRVVAPHQKVSGGAAKYTKFAINNHIMIGTIHSHANFSAFHSGIDDTDEKFFDGIHITFGHLADENISISASIVINGSRFMIDPVEYIDKISLVSEQEQIFTPSIYKMVDNKMVIDEEASKKASYVKKSTDKRYTFKVSKDKFIFDSSWMNAVEKLVYKPISSQHTIYDYDNIMYRQFSLDDEWASYYNSFKNNLRIPPVRGSSSPLNIGPIKEAGITFPPHFIDENPCYTCIHRESKIIDEEFDIEYENDLEHYKCKKCDFKFSTLEVEPLCPICNSDEYLEEIDKVELKENYYASENEIIKKISNDAGTYLNESPEFHIETIKQAHPQKISDPNKNIKHLPYNNEGKE